MSPYLRCVLLPDRCISKAGRLKEDLLQDSSRCLTWLQGIDALFRELSLSIMGTNIRNAIRWGW